MSRTRIPFKVSFFLYALLCFAAIFTLYYVTGTSNAFTFKTLEVDSAKGCGCKENDVIPSKGITQGKKSNV